MKTALDYRIEDVQKVTLNGVQKLTFKAYRKEAEGFVFAGQHSAPAKTAKRDLWKIADQA